MLFHPATELHMHSRTQKRAVASGMRKKRKPELGVEVFVPAKSFAATVPIGKG
jgi:hypothetical protein